MNATARKKNAIIAVVVAVIAALMGFFATLSMGIGKAGSTASTIGPNPDYPTNASGQTYGSSAAARSPAQEPNLVRVYGNSGKEGYVLSTDLADPEFSTPDQAIAWQNSPASKLPRAIPVFDVEGILKIDTFTIEPVSGAINTVVK